MRKILKRCVFTSLFLILCLSIAAFWLISTSSGLTTLVYSVQALLPGTLTIDKITGNFFNDIILTGVSYQDPHNTFTANTLLLKGNWQHLLQKNLSLSYFQIENANFVSRSPVTKADAKNPETHLSIETAEGKLEFFEQGQHIHFKLLNFLGNLNQKPIKISGEAQIDAGLVKFYPCEFHWGDHQITVQPRSIGSNTVGWVYQGKLTKNSSATNNSKTNNSVTNNSKSNSSATTHRVPGLGSKIKLLGEATFTPLGCTLNQTELYLDNKKTATLVGNLSLENSSSKPFKTRTLQGHFQAAMLDLGPIYHFLPMISRLKAQPKVSAEISGNVMNPIIALQGDVGNAIFSLPQQRITVKQFQLQVAGLLHQGLKVKGSGTISGNAFSLNGLWQPLINGQPGDFQLIGHTLPLVNTANIHIVASPNLHLHYHAKTLGIQGTIEITQGDIVLKKELTSVIVSNDLIYVDPMNKETPKETIHLQPEIQFIIANNLHFKGHGLDANLGGKLQITQRKDGIYTGQGRIVIREGKYRLPNGTGNIHRGTLYYPPGTLLQDPLLDIRVLQRGRDKLNAEGDVGVYVQGSLQKPQYHLYSSQGLQGTEILSKLGFGGTQFEGEDNQRKMLSQTAVLLGGGTNPLLEDIKTKFGLEEFGIQSGPTSQYIATQKGNDATLVVGKSLSDRVYLQFMQGMLVPNSTLILQYFITPYLFISGQTSTSGLGGDISFSIEKD